MTRTNRRRFVQQIGLAAGPGFAAMTAAKDSGGAIGFAFGTYGMQSMKTPDALRLLAEIGYNGVELALMPGWVTEPKLISSGDRAELRRMMTDLGLALPAMLESLPLLGSPEKRAVNLERLKQAAQLANDLSPSKPPVLDTILGSETSAWESVKGRMVEELKDWMKVSEPANFVVCIKPHAGHAVHTPERALWLIREVGSPNLRVVYDYSHFFVEGLPLASSLRELLPVSPFISVKDSVGTPAKHEFLLPGEGKTDYVAYFKLLKELGYRGFVSVEVSSMIFRKPGYDPVSTAKLCYGRLAPAFARAGVRRPTRNG
jgi:sugar phosphate isomerase/epimerase